MNKASSLKIAAVYIGTVVGAGFATGQEVLQFFSAFGIRGLWGITLTTALFIIYGYIIIELGLKFSAKSHLEVLKPACGKWLTKLMDIIITFFLFGALTAMIAGTGTLFSEQFHLPLLLGSFLMAAITAITVLTGISGVLNSISFIAPFLIVSVVSISLYSIFHNPPNLSITLHTNFLINNWLMATVLYVSYNILLSLAILGPLGAESKNKKSVRLGAILGGLGLGLSSLMIYLAISGYMPEVGNIEVPLGFIAKNISPIVQILFSIILISEVYTTAVGALFGFTARLKDSKKISTIGKTAWPIIVVSTSILAFFASLFGFSNLVKFLYPIVGYAGIVLLICLLLTKLPHRKKS